MTNNRIVYDHNGKKINLIPLNKSGGEGEIYNIMGDKQHCIKIFHPKKRTTELHEKIKVMLANPPEERSKKHVSITWPKSIIYNKPSCEDFIGYSMPFIDTNSFLESHQFYDPEDRIKFSKGNFTWLHLSIAAYNLASSVAAIHKKGHRIGDIRESNIFIGRNALITLIDCDSFQIKDNFSDKVYYTRVGTPEYLPPELLHVNFNTGDYDRYYSDLFGLGILIFRLLMNGVHPYQAKGKLVANAPTTADKIKKGYFPYVNCHKDIAPPNFAPSFDMIPPSIRQLFCKCFVEGHSNPRKRPTAKEWYNSLKVEIQK